MKCARTACDHEEEGWQHTDGTKRRYCGQCAHKINVFHHDFYKTTDDLIRHISGKTAQQLELEKRKNNAP